MEPTFGVARSAPPCSILPAFAPGPPVCGACRTSASQDVSNAENSYIRLVGQPATLSRTPSKMAARPPEFGEQTDEVLAEFGFTADKVGALKRDKVV
jgi:crotonobetainyl-CoA:carnitine CoA-transferase CaiB-like acyl-CoA transferase